jgi:hypothetical protein
MFSENSLLTNVRFHVSFACECMPPLSARLGHYVGALGAASDTSADAFVELAATLARLSVLRYCKYTYLAS